MGYTTYLIHHGIKGQRWGFRRYQNPDGTLTEAGKVRYMKKAEHLEESYQASKRKMERKKAKYTRYMNRPWLFSYTGTAVRLNQKVYKAEKKLNKKVKKASAFFEKEVKQIYNKGLDDKQIKHLSELGESFVYRQKR